MVNQKILFVGLVVVCALFAGMFVFSDNLKSYSLNGATDFAEKMSTSSGLTTITVDGQATKSIQPDQLAIIVNVNTPPDNVKSVLYQKSIIQENLIKAVKDATDNDSKVQIIPRISNVNPAQYSQTDSSSRFVAYFSIPVKIKPENLAAFSKQTTDLGFRVDYVSIIPIQKDQTEDGTTKDAIISVLSGSSSPNCDTTMNCFDPQEIIVGTGSVLLWQNDDTAAHTITSGNPSDGPDGKFDSNLFLAGRTFSQKFEQVGEFPYFCLVHPWMTGKVIVKDDAEKIVAPTPKLTGEFELSVTIVQETKPDTIQNTIDAYMKKTEQLQPVLQEMGITQENMPTPNININPAYYGAGKPSSFSGLSQFLIETTPDHLERVVDAVVAQNATIENIYMKYSTSALDYMRKELTQLALDDAKNRVGEIIDPMRLEIKGIKSIKINQLPQYSQYGNPIAYERGVGIPTDYSQSGSTMVSATVEFEVGK